MKVPLRVLSCSVFLAFLGVGCCMLNTASSEQLIVKLKDKDWRVRAKASEVLGKRREIAAIGPLIAVLRDDDTDVAVAAGTALTRIGKPAIPELLEAMKDDPLCFQPEPGITGASKVLAMMGKNVVESVIQMLKSEDFRVRVNAAKVLGEVGDQRAVEPLRASLNDEVWRVRVNARWALEEIGETHRGQ